MQSEHSTYQSCAAPVSDFMFISALFEESIPFIYRPAPDIWLESREVVKLQPFEEVRNRPFAIQPVIPGGG